MISWSSPSPPASTRSGPPPPPSSIALPVRVPLALLELDDAAGGNSRGGSLGGLLYSLGGGPLVFGGCAVLALLWFGVSLTMAEPPYVSSLRIVLPEGVASGSNGAADSRPALPRKAWAIPLLLFGGSMWTSMSIVMIGGLALGTLITLGLIPALYAALYRIHPTEEA